MGIAINIRSLLASAKCLVVIDDLWSLDYLDWLSSFLGIRKTASKLVATTRFQELATSNPSIVLFKLRHLTEEESLELLVHRVCVNIPEDLQLHGTLEFIVKRCKGIPLAINVLGSLLATKQTSGEWKAALRAIELCNVHQEDTLQLLELEILSLCYDDMPHHLKLCFFYLGLFSEQPNIEVETPYQLWMAEGFVQPDNEESAITMMDAAEQYLDELATRGFVEVNEAEVPNIRRFKSCRLHSMMLDLCLHKAKQEIFSEVIRSCQRNEINKSPTPFGNIRRLSMNVGGGYQSEDVMAVLLKNADMHLGYLRVLRFDGFELRESKFVGEVGKLTSLRYLNFRDYRLNNLPLSLGELLNLQTLDLRVVIDRMVTIPNIIWKLKRLRHLYLPSKFNAREDDKLRLDSLVNLETLENFDSNACSTTDLLFLTSLRNLTASVKGNAKSLQGIIKRINMNQNCLCQTSIRVRCFDAFTAEERNLSMSQLLECPSLHTLQIKGYMSILPHIIRYSLTRIVLSRSALVNDPMATLGRFPNLWDHVLENGAFLGKTELFCIRGIWSTQTSYTLKFVKVGVLD
ncbi:putative disease resistance protein At1g58400 [Coffea eugenioides]|uniref:putative disease resistance protein At1g58400 n=1 Tax=Coffea eugenioides TaxID=49369 RepID=UPI000F609AF6|nr:putative disease resistance protein At1g58400 [Coffea eugenioides]